MQVIELPIQIEHIDKAREKSAEMGKLRNSIADGAGNLAGFVGEFVVADHIGAKVCNTYDYDLIKDGVKIDVKTKRTNYTPQPNYLCSIAAYNIKQKCDVYYFVRVKNDFTVAWVLGYYDKYQFFQDAFFRHRGDLDDDGKFKFKADCYNLRISDLKQFSLDSESKTTITTGS